MAQRPVVPSSISFCSPHTPHRMAASRSCTGLRGSGDRSGLYAFVPTGESGGGPDIRGRGPEQNDGRDPSVGMVVCPLSASAVSDLRSAGERRAHGQLRCLGAHCIDGSGGRRDAMSIVAERAEIGVAPGTSRYRRSHAGLRSGVAPMQFRPGSDGVSWPARAGRRVRPGDPQKPQKDCTYCSNAATPP
jgi:hypothetical protein